MSKTRGRVQKKARHRTAHVPRVKHPKPPPVDLAAIEGRSLRTRGMQLLNQRARAWRKLDRLKHTELMGEGETECGPSKDEST